MGADQSKPSSEEQKVFPNTGETPIHFSQDLVNHLSDSIASPTVTPERQATLDSRVSAELARLRAEEEDVRQQIEAALERENLDRERDLADAHSDASEEAETGSRKATSSDMLRGDLEEVQRKVQRFQERRQLGDFPDIREKQQVLLECYNSHPTTPLDCWRVVDEFKDAIARAEKIFVDSLR